VLPLVIGTAEVEFMELGVEHLKEAEMILISVLVTGGKVLTSITKRNKR
jgi:hypothetical protein